MTQNLEMTKEFIEQSSQPCSDGYDPNHPDADWSGFVSKRTSRKHMPCKPDQLTAIDGNGFGPGNNVSTEEWTKPARKIVGHRESGADSESGEKDQLRSSTFSLIGGPVPPSIPSKFSPECWETEAQAANRKLKTDLHQLTDNGRSQHVRGRKGSVLDCTQAKNATRENEPCCKSEENIRKDPTNFIGFRASNVRVTCNDSSFLKDLGDAVVNLRSSASFVTDAVTPFDPYKSASGERRKDLLYENFSSVVPGYTGKRTFIS